MEATHGTPLPERAAAILRQRPIGYLATMCLDGRMSVVPLAVIYDGEHIRITTRADTRKVRNLRRDPRVTLCVPQPDNLAHYVEIRGTAEITDDTDRAFVNKMAREWMGLDEYPYDKPGDQRLIITVHPEVVRCPKVHGASD